MFAYQSFASLDGMHNTCRALIPMHADLRLAGALPPLDAPHHMRATEWAMYREGVVVNSVPGEGSLLNVGLDKVSYAFLTWHLYFCIAATSVRHKAETHCIHGSSCSPSIWRRIQHQPCSRTPLLCVCHLSTVSTLVQRVDGLARCRTSPKLDVSADHIFCIGTHMTCLLQILIQ